MVVSIRGRRGTTLLEIILVMAILVILGALIYPTLEAMYRDTRVQAAADQVCGAWAEARVRSIDSGTPYRFAVKSDSGKYRIAPESTEFWGGSSGGNSDEDSDDGKVLVGTLSQSITFQMESEATDTVNGWQIVATFLPDGTCRDDAQIVLRADDCQPLVVSVRSLTGISRVQPQKQLQEESP